MALETSTYINGLVATNPTSSDNLSEGDNHIRLLKSTIKATFPNVSGAVTSTHTAINLAVTDANNATNANTASRIVKRDGSGNFSAGTITATFNGNVTGNVTGSVTGNVTGNASGSSSSCTGNSATATKWATARTITLGGDASGSVSIDGTANQTLTVTVNDDSHNHTIANVDGLQSALDAKLASSSYTASDVLTKIKTVDGSGSGLDADTVDGLQASAFLQDSDFTQNLTANGWTKLPNGLMIQWGTKLVSGNAVNSSQSFNTTFPNAVFQVVATSIVGGASENDNWGLGASSPTTSTFYLTNGNGNGRYFRWIAVGY